MPTTYQTADDEVTALVSAVMTEHHQALAHAGVRVGVLMAYKPDGAPIKHAGYEALATIKVVSLKDRVTKQYDAELLIDETEYARLPDEQRAALVDHELSHLTLAKKSLRELQEAQQHDSAAPWWKLDDLGRPKLKTVNGDWNAGDGFKDVVARHGTQAVEYLNLARAKAKADAARAEVG